MKRIIIDFSGSRYIGELHSRIREAFLQSTFLIFTEIIWTPSGTV